MEDAKAADAIGQLSELLRDPAKHEQLESHRGVVGLIEDRLRELSDAVQVAGQHASYEHMADYPEGEPDLHVDRIILHIDDLDRCTPERVVDMLQAIALLNAAPMFVVVVSVDPRWLNKSLAHHEITSFSGAGVHYKLGERVGHPLDYLDKIFQIPYAIPRIGPDAAGAFLTDLAVQSRLVSADQLRALSATAEESQPPSKDGDQNSHGHGQEEPTPSTEGKRDAGDVDAKKLDDRLYKHGRGRAGAASGRRRDRHHSMTLNAHEVHYLSLVAGWLTTPRAVK